MMRPLNSILYLINIFSTFDDSYPLKGNNQKSHHNKNPFRITKKEQRTVKDPFLEFKLHRDLNNRKITATRKIK